MAIVSNVRRRKGNRGGTLKLVTSVFTTTTILALAFAIYPLITREEVESLSSVAEQKGQVAENGWKSVDIFYGERNLRTKGRRSQCKQDDLVAAVLKNVKNGYFLDLAANEAVNLSNTYLLEKNFDWTGICVEPNPRYWPDLAHRKCHVAAAVVAKERMQKVKFRMYNDMPKRGASGGIDEFVDPNIPKSKDPPTELYAVPAIEILEKYNAPRVMEYLSLDIEGVEYMVMKDFPFDSYKFKIMTVERPSQELTDLFYANGYLYLGGNNEIGHETAWIHSDFLKEIDVTGVEKVNWIGGKSTRWVTLNEKDRWAKPTINDKRIKK